MPRRLTKGQPKKWIPCYLEPSLWDRSADMAVNLSQADFAKALNQQMQDFGQIVLPDDVVSLLFKIVRRGLVLRETVREAKLQIKTKDWRKRKQTVRKLQRTLRST